MPTHSVRVGVRGPDSPDGPPLEFDIDGLTDEQWTQYSVARREGRLHITVDSHEMKFVMAEQLTAKTGFDTSQLAEGAEIVDQSHVIAFGAVSEAHGNIKQDGTR